MVDLLCGGGAVSRPVAEAASAVLAAITRSPGHWATIGDAVDVSLMLDLLAPRVPGGGIADIDHAYRQQVVVAVGVELALRSQCEATGESREQLEASIAAEVAT